MLASKLCRFQGRCFVLINLKKKKKTYSLTVFLACVCLGITEVSIIRSSAGSINLPPPLIPNPTSNSEKASPFFKSLLFFFWGSRSRARARGKRPSPEWGTRGQARAKKQCHWEKKSECSRSTHLPHGLVATNIELSDQRSEFLSIYWMIRSFHIKKTREYPMTCWLLWVNKSPFKALICVLVMTCRPWTSRDHCRQSL